MSSKLLTLLAALALAMFGLAACGGDDDEEPATPDAATTEDTATTGGSTGGGGSTVSFTADPSGGLAYQEDSAEASAGTVTLELTNDASVPHDDQVEGPDGDLGGTETVSGDSTSAEVELEPGEYTFYCSVPGHRESGMEGPLTVE